MIVELLGPGGVGKTTVEPLVAELLEIPYHPSTKRHGSDGTELTVPRIWLTRVGSVVTEPRVVWRSMAVLRTGSIADRARFAVDMARRNKSARRAAASGSGVVASGSVHALAMMAAATRADLRPLLGSLTLADVYVSLDAEPDTVRRRLSERWEQAGIPFENGNDWFEHYRQAMDTIAKTLPRPHITVDANAEPAAVASEVAERLRPYVAPRETGR